MCGVVVAPHASGDSSTIDLSTVDTPLARLLHKHILEQCDPFIIQYNNAIELDASRTYILRRKNRVGVCMHIINKRLNTVCARQVLRYQHALGQVGESESKASAESVDALREAEGRLLFCARFPRPINLEAQNPRPVEWYFKPREGGADDDAGEKAAPMTQQQG